MSALHGSRHFIAHPAHRTQGVGSLGIGPAEQRGKVRALPAPRKTPRVAIAAGGEATWHYTSVRLIDVLQASEATCPFICQSAWDGADWGIEESGTYDCVVLLGSPAAWGPQRQRRLAEHCRAGRPLVALAATRAVLPAWPEFASEVLGGCDRTPPVCTAATVRRSEAAWHHPILGGEDGFAPFAITADVYRGPRLKSDASILLEADVRDGGKQRTLPVAWLRRYRGGRVFCSTLGRAADFDNDSFAALAARAVAWASAHNRNDSSSK